jgi:hypothetical protein
MPTDEPVFKPAKVDDHMCKRTSTYRYSSLRDRAHVTRVEPIGYPRVELTRSCEGEGTLGDKKMCEL